MTGWVPAMGFGRGIWPWDVAMGFGHGIWPYTKPNDANVVTSVAGQQTGYAGRRGIYPASGIASRLETAVVVMLNRRCASLDRECEVSVVGGPFGVY